MSASITFTHSLPLDRVMCFLGRAVTLRVAARECRFDAAKYPNTKASQAVRAWLEACALDGEERAAAIERMVQVVQPFPKASMHALEFIDSVMHPARSAKDLMAFAEHVEKAGVDGLMAAVRFGFRRPPMTNHAPQLHAN
jgi:hypothetical protein